MSTTTAALPQDSPHVIAPPPLIALATVVAGFLLDWLLPINALAAMLSFSVRLWLGVLLAVSGAAIAIIARNQFTILRTNVQPWKPALRLATTGIYQYVRNPMYSGMLLLVAGIGIGFASLWTLILLVPMALVLQYGVVLREERYLAGKFGDEYRSYNARVRRWGIC